MNRRRLPAILSTDLALIALIGCGGGETPTAPTERVNRAPEFDTPLRVAEHNREYRFRPTVTDADGDGIELTLVSGPAWLSFEDGTLAGTPGRGNLGTHAVRLRAFDGQINTFLSYDITVGWGEIICDQEWVAPAESPYILPYPAGKTYFIIQSYCSIFSHSGWFAYDIDTQIGDTLIASRAGVVIFKQESFMDNTNVNGEQNFMMIQHDDGSVAFYVHLMEQGALFDVGDRVEQGEPFALSGNSGATAGPHLHMVLFYDIRTRKENSAPLSFNNAEGDFDGNGGLARGQSYKAVGGD